MNKAYSILAASAIILAGAADFSADAASIRERAPKKSLAAPILNAFGDEAGALKLDEQARNVRGLRKADGQPTIEGAWTFMLGDYYFADSEDRIIPGHYYAVLEEGNKVSFYPVGDIYGNKFNGFKGTYDPSTNKVSFTKMFLGIAYGYYIYQVPYRYNAEELYELVGTYVPDEGAIYFNPHEGLSWDGFTNTVGEGRAEGSLWAFEFCYALNLDASASIEGGWTDIGLATFVDGWLIPGMGLDQKENSYDVLLQQSNDNKWVYRLVNPYFSGPMAEYNRYEGDGYIVFDISDPDHVLFLPCNAGFANPNFTSSGIDNFHVYNYLGYLAASNPDMTVEDIIFQNGDDIPYTTYKDGVITLSCLTTYLDYYDEEIITYDANFGYNYYPFGGSIWSELNMEASITFPSWYDAEVGAIAVDEDAPAVYFDINGLKVNNPVKGQLVIKREGNKVTKEIVK